MLYSGEDFDSFSFVPCWTALLTSVCGETQPALTPETIATCCVLSPLLINMPPALALAVQPLGASYWNTPALCGDIAWMRFVYTTLLPPIVNVNVRPLNTAVKLLFLPLTTMLPVNLLLVSVAVSL